MNKTWIKIFRSAIYVIAVIGLAIGVGLIKSASTSSSYADGTAAAKLSNGLPIFFTALTLLIVNIFWGTLRWFLRGYNEHWSAKRIIGKLIGGGIWRSIVFSLLFIVPLLALTPVITSVISANLTAENAAFTPYNPSEISDRLQYLGDHLSEYTREEAVAKYQELTLSNLDFDPDYTAPATSWHPFTKNASATTQKVSKLTKAKLSSSSNFVVFYTDQGDDAITDSQAAGLAEMLESIIRNYSTNLGFEYSYEKISVGILKDTGIKKVLKSSNIDENILNTAMPVYVANPYTEATNVLASYAGRRFTELGTSILISLGSLFGEETAKLYDSAPSYPFINILPSNVSDASLASVTAHELGHHYAANYNQQVYGKTGSDDDFVDETGPNWMAINVVTDAPVEGVLNGGHYNRTYLRSGTGYTISDSVPDFDGYPPVAFLQNYYEIVPDGKTKIMDAIYYGDALNYLFNQAGADDFAKVMTSLAEKNLTGDYGGKLVNYILPQGEPLNCTDVCTASYQINPAATEYLYFVTEEYNATSITFSGTDSATASLVGKDLSGAWQVVNSGQQKIDFEIADDTVRQFEILALAVANSSITSAETYTVAIEKSELAELIDEDGEYQINLPDSAIITDLGGNCFRINLAALFEFAGQFVDLAEAKSTAAPYDITLCANLIENNLSFDAARAKLKSAMDYSFDLFDTTIDGLRVNTFVSFDLFSRRAKAYVLLADGTDLGLVTISVDPRQ